MFDRIEMTWPLNNIDPTGFRANPEIHQKTCYTFDRMLYDFEDHNLFITPKVSYFSSLQGGASRHMMVNGSSHRIAIKIKCSDNELFRVSPVYCLLEPGSAQRLQIVRDPGPAKHDKIILLYKSTCANSPRDAFQNDPIMNPERRMIALIAKDDLTLSIAPTTNLKSILRQNIPKRK